MVTLLKDYEQQTYFLNSGDDIDGIVFRNGDQVFLIDQNLLLIYDQGNDNWQPVPTGGGGGGGPGPQWTLIGESTHNLPEYTDTANSEATTDTNINVQNTDYCWFLVVVTCDTPIETSTEWGMTIAMLGATTTGLIYAPSSLCWYWQKGTATLSRAALSATVQYNGNNIGVYFQPSNNQSTVKFSRRANTAYCPKMRAGNYTVKVYGLSSL